ncbi:cation:proton antiporter, partial [Vibrio splendidus]
MDLSITSSLALIGLLSLACQLLGWRLRLPAILPLLIVGLLLGPGLKILNPDAIFGDVLFPLISLGVAIILFEGALTLNFKEIRGHGRMVTHLVSFGMLITWACIVVGAYYFVDFSWPLAALFAALVVVTGPTVIVPMLRSIQPKSSLGSILRWEGIVIDPIGALFAVLVYEYIVSSADPTSHVLSALGLTLAIGLGLGIIGGYLIAKMLKGHWVPHYLRNVAVLTLMLAAFSFSNDLSEESGLLTVTIMGIWLANVKGLDLEDIIEFKETLTVLLISALFILLASRLDSGTFLSIGWGGIGLLAVVMLVARPLSVWISGIGTDLTSADKWFLSWMAPRGIVAAAVSSLFAIKLQEKQLIEGADLLVPMVFLVIIGTVVIQSLTASWWARRLGVTQEKAQGVIFFGATHFSRQFAKVLATHNINSVLADTNWESIRLARMDNLNVYFGNPASSHAENNLELDGIGRAMIVSPYRQTNPLVSMH